MKIKELIAELQQHDPEMEIGGVARFTHCTCWLFGDSNGPCYCPEEDHEFAIENLNFEKNFDKKNRKQETVRVLIRMERNW